jgi:hypothetical protein
MPLVNYEQVSIIEEPPVKSELKSKFDKLLEFLEKRKNVKEKPVTDSKVVEPEKFVENSDKNEFLNQLNLFSQVNELSDSDKNNLTLLAELESSFRQNPSENDIALGYFQITPTNIKKYGVNNLNTFKNDPQL